MRNIWANIFVDNSGQDVCTQVKICKFKSIICFVSAQLHRQFITSVYEYRCIQNWIKNFLPQFLCILQICSIWARYATTYAHQKLFACCRQPKLRLIIVYLCLLSAFTNSKPPREEHCLMDADIVHRDTCNKLGGRSMGTFLQRNTLCADLYMLYADKNAPTASHWLPRKKFLKSVMNLNTKLQKRITTLFPTGRLCKNTLGQC